MSPRFALRSATSKSHEAIDRLFSRFALDERAGYSDFLLAQAGAFLGVEDALSRAGAADVFAGWTNRTRSAELRQDLAALGLPPPDPVALPTFPSEAAMLGGIYVLEGSRLGGAMLIRSVPDHFPTEFLTAGDPAFWRAFIAVLDERLSLPAALNTAVASATEVFETFACAARRILVTNRP